MRHTRFLSILLAATSLAIVGSPVRGNEVKILDRSGRVIAVVSLAEATHTLEFESQQLPGWPVLAGGVQSTPAVADVDGDGRPDVAFSSFDANLHVVDVEGIHLSGWPVELSFGTEATPSLVDLDGDGPLEVFAGHTLMRGLRHDGTVVAGWPQAGSRVFSTASVEDVDGDGLVEIAATDEDRAYLWESNGQTESGWPVAFPLPTAGGNGPALGDMDGDDTLEIAVPLAGFPSLYVFEVDGTVIPGFPFSFEPFALPAGVSLADVTGTGVVELAFQKSSDVWVLDGDGRLAPGWPVPNPGVGNSPPAVGDLDGDGRLEIVWGTVGGDGQVVILKDDGTPQPGWPVIVPAFSFNAQPTLGDVDGDGGVDVVLGGFTATFGRRGRVYAWNADGALIDGFPIAVPDSSAVVFSSVTITDLDLDGDVDLVVGTISGTGSGSSGAVFAFDLDAPYDPTTMEWPTLGHNVRHTSRYEPPPRKAEMTIIPPLLNLQHPPRSIRVQASVPEGMEGLLAELALVNVQGRPVRLEAESLGPTTHGGSRQVVLFDSAAVVSLMKEKLDPVPGTVRLDFAAGEAPGIHGFTTVELR